MDINRKRLSFSALTFRKRKPSALTRETVHAIKAFDTETYKGYARLIADSDGDYILEPDADMMLSFLTKKSNRQAHIFTYNLRFDAQAVLKLLPNANIKEISSNKKTEYHGYTIKYIPKKLLTIKDENKHVVRCYDLAQYFETSLEKAAEAHLSQRKIDFKYRETMNSDINVWRDYESDIITYCKQDALVTAELGKFLDKKFYEQFYIKPQSYISKGSLGKFLVRQRCFIPDINEVPLAALSLAFYAYKGGRFEALMKGHFEYAELYDIVSAYPFEIANLIDMTKGKWRPCTKVNDEAYYGFYVCNVHVPYQRLCPLAYIMKQGHLIYPFGQWYTYLTKQEIEAYSPYANIKVISGYEFYPDKIVYPFKQHIAALFMKKKHTSKTDYAYDLVKKMMNSVYGSFYEKIKRDNQIVAGMLFNPVYATVITANTRIKLYLFSKKYEQDVISLATDSVLFKGKHNIRTSKELGEWDLDGSGNTTVLMNGIYEMESKLKSRGIEAKTESGSNKGLKTPYGDMLNVFDYMRKRPYLSEYPYFSDRPVQMAEAVKSTEAFSIADINTWREFKKSIHIDHELKRYYQDEFKYGINIFNKCIDSKPLIVRGEIGAISP